MRILTVTIKNYKSIVSIDKLSLSKDISTLVGANEHGKSNILRAIRLLNPSNDLSDGDARKDSESQIYHPSVSFEVEFNSEDREKIEQIVLANTPAEELKPLPTNIVYRRYRQKDKDTGETRTYYSIQFEGRSEEVANAIYEYLKTAGPQKIIYFDEFVQRLGSQIQESEINDPGNSIVNGLMKIARLDDVKTELFTDNSRVKLKLQQASEHATKDVRNAWRQGNDDDISLMLNRGVDRNLSIDVLDKNTFVDFGSRSRGFQWFLSFYLNYRSQHDGDLANADSIFIVDEPGIFLHPLGQKDLLRYLEQLANNNQVIYTTHSPFLINRLKPNNITVVEKLSDMGTVINQKGYSSNWRPLRTSLGMVLSDSFYFADKTLVVEGVEDQIYITSLIKFFFKEEVFPSLDVNLLSIIAAGGAAEMPAVVRIVADESRPVAALIDSDRPNDYSRLAESAELGKEDALKQISDFGSSKTITIQDLLPKTLYVDAVNAYVTKLKDDGTLTPKKGKEGDFSLSEQTKSDKAVDKFVSDAYGVDDVSKVGIAREFEALLEPAKYNKTTFKKSEALISWIVNTLLLEIET